MTLPITITPRQLAATVGVLLAIAGLAVLLWPVTVTVDNPFGFTEQVSCGNTLGVVDRPVCADDLATHRAWGWPLLAVGVAVVVSALFVKIAPQTREDA